MSRSRYGVHVGALRVLAMMLLIWLQGGAGGAAAAGAPDGRSIILQQTTIGPMPTDGRAWSIAPDAGRVALAANSGSRQQVFIDGNPSALYSNLATPGSFGQGDIPRMLMISPDGQLVAFVAQKSPGEMVMVVNNKEGPPFERIGSARFSAIGHHLIYTAFKGGHAFVVLDGNVGAGYRGVNSNEIHLTDDGAVDCV